MLLKIVLEVCVYTYTYNDTSFAMICMDFHWANSFYICLMKGGVLLNNSLKLIFINLYSTLAYIKYLFTHAC